MPKQPAQQDDLISRPQFVGPFSEKSVWMEVPDIQGPIGFGLTYRQIVIFGGSPHIWVRFDDLYARSATIDAECQTAAIDCVLVGYDVNVTGARYLL